MRSLLLLANAALLMLTGCSTIAHDSTSRGTPCDAFFKQPGGSCLFGALTVETDVGPNKKILSSKLVSVSTDRDSAASIAPIAQCMADNMSFYSKWYIKNLEVPGKRTNTIRVVGKNTCPES